MWKRTKTYLNSLEFFEKVACDRRVYKAFTAKFKSITKVRGLMPYLLEDDRIGCEYLVMDPQDDTKVIDIKVLTGGYFRFYNPDEDMIYLSPFKRSMQLGLIPYAGERNLKYLKWKVSSIGKLYIKPATEERIKNELSKPVSRRSESMGNIMDAMPRPSSTRAPTERGPVLTYSAQGPVLTLARVPGPLVPGDGVPPAPRYTRDSERSSERGSAPSAEAYGRGSRSEHTVHFDRLWKK